MPLEVERLVKRFGETVALDDVSLTVRAGECVGLLGPNGAGKSTLIRSIVGRVIPNSGRVTVFGAAAGSTAARMALGWVPQELAIYPRISCKENLASFGRYYGLRGQPLKEAIAWCLHWAALEDRQGEVAKKLSGGMKRRLNMAAGMMHRPNVMLLDEPTVGVDPQSRNAIFDNLETLKKRGKTLVYTTHYMEEAERLCDRLVIIDRGKVIADDDMQGLHRLLPAANVLSIELKNADGLQPEEMRALPGVHSAGMRGATLRIEVRDLAADSPGILQWLAARGYSFESLTSERASLETVFLTLTGRSLRD